MHPPRGIEICKANISIPKVIKDRIAIIVGLFNTLLILIGRLSGQKVIRKHWH